MNPMKKARSLFSLILSLALVVTSLPMVFMTAVAETGEGTEPTYYVSWQGDDENDGLSAEAPLKTIAAAVNKIGLANDGTIVIVDTTCEIYAYAELDAQKVVIYDAPVHTGTITYRSVAEGTQAVMCIGTAHMYMNGPSVFRNINFYAGYKQNNEPQFVTQGNNLIFEGVINFFYQTTHNADNVSTVANDGFKSLAGLELGPALHNAVSGSTIQLKHTGISIKPLRLATKNKSTINMKGTVQTFIIDGAPVDTIRLKMGATNYNNTYYAGTVNYIINSDTVNTITANFQGSDNTGITEYENLTILFNNGAGANTVINAKSWAAKFTSNKTWIVFSEGKEGCTLSITETPGTFIVNGGKIATAVNRMSGAEVVSENGLLVLPSTWVGAISENAPASNIAGPDKSGTGRGVWDVTYSDPAPDYTAAISSAATTVERGANVAVKVAVASTVKENWASAQLSVEYDADRLTFIPEDNAPYTYVDNNGVITIGIYGDTKALGDVVTLNFATKAEAADCDVATTVTLTEAGFSTQKDAEESDLSVADITADEAVITITKKTVTITVNATDNGNPILDLDAEAITEGSDIVFGIVSGGENYNYTVSYKVGDGEAVALTPDQDGNYTVPGAAVTDNITITATRTPKTFSVSGSVTAGDGATLNENDTVKVGDVTLPNENVTATFGTAITFKIPANVAAGLQAGANYTFTVKVNGTALTSGYSVSADGTEITVDGAYITGNVEIAVVKNYLAPNVFTVTVNGDGASDVTVSADQVALNAPLTITLNKVAGYDYTVTVTMGDQTLTLTPVDGVYSIEGVTANVTVTVTKTAAYELSASVYFNVNNTTAWLVVNKVAKLESGNYTFNGIQMMWTDSYGGAYVTVVFADANPTLEGTVAIDASTTAAVVENKLDANKTGKIDANDAQFVYNVYNGDYTAITADVTVEKLLRADVNGDKTVDSVDAQAIISEVVK